MHKIISLVVLFFYFFCLFFPVSASAADSATLYTYYFWTQWTYNTSPGEYIDAGKANAFYHSLPLNDYFPKFALGSDANVKYGNSLYNIRSMFFTIQNIYYYGQDTPIPDSQAIFNLAVTPYGEGRIVLIDSYFSLPCSGHSFPNPTEYSNNNEILAFTFRPTAAKSLPHDSTYTIDINVYFTLSVDMPLDLSGLSSSINAGLLSVSSNLDKINQSIQIFNSAVQSNFNNIDARLLELIQAVNNSSSSGGGTTAIVDALKNLQNDIVDFRTDNVEGLGNLNTTLSHGVKDLQDKLDLINESTKDIVGELRRIQQEANDRAESGSGQIQGMVQSLEQGTRERWEVIFFPVDFTRQIFSIFSQGTASEYYRTNYKNIVGYKYNDETYCLDPIYDYSKTDFPTTRGTKITFPEFVLDIPHYGRYVIWESFTYDLKELVADFDIMFEAMHLFSGILLIYWTVDYILDFFQEVIED